MVETKWLWGVEGSIYFLIMFSRKQHWLASTASERKGAKIQHYISWFYPPNFFSKPQNKTKFKNMEDPGVFSCDFPGLRTSAVSMTLAASFHQNIYWSWWLIIPGTQMTNNGPFLWNLSSIFQFFHLYLIVGSCWGHLMLLFWKQFEETQMSKPQEATRHHSF